jgi:hypothetical protein
LESGGQKAYNTRTAEKVSKKETPAIPRGETMLLSYRAVLPTLFSPRLTPPRRKRHPLNTLEVVFSTTGDLIRVHSYGDQCSATWDAVMSHGRLEPEGGDGAGVAIWPDEKAWLDKIRALAAGWVTAVEAVNRSGMARAATRIQRYDDRSDGLIDLVIAWPPDRRW